MITCFSSSLNSFFFLIPSCVVNKHIDVLAQGTLHNPCGSIKELLEVIPHHDHLLLFFAQLFLLPLLLFPFFLLLLFGGGRFDILDLWHATWQDARGQLTQVSIWGAATR